MEILAEGAVIGYGQRDVVDHLDLQVSGGITAILGPVDSGKTTVMRALATLLPPRSGRLLLDGHDVRVTATARRLRADIRYLPQDAGLEPAMSVRDHLHYAAWVCGITRQATDHHVRRVLADLGLTDHAGTRTKRLPDEERRWVSLAGALIGTPRLILLDGAFDDWNGVDHSRLRRILRGQASATVVVTARERVDVRGVADRAISLGSLMSTATTVASAGGRG
ncbi:MAG: type transport system ATP-binding protein [Actinomycetota bacterium]|nr:type transport system ATP-binding protein [Actinomycetota bacterium]